MDRLPTLAAALGLLFFLVSCTIFKNTEQQVDSQKNAHWTKDDLLIYEDFLAINGLDSNINNAFGFVFDVDQQDLVRFPFISTLGKCFKKLTDSERLEITIYCEEFVKSSLYKIPNSFQEKLSINFMVRDLNILNDSTIVYDFSKIFYFSGGDKALFSFSKFTGLSLYTRSLVLYQKVGESWVFCGREKM